LLCLALALPALGQGGAGKGSAPPVGLDALLKLPSDTAPPTVQPSRGGYTRQEWRERFATARGELSQAERRLADAQEELGELASGTSSWQVAAPGGAAGASGENGPLSYSLREQIRRSREEIEAAEQALTELRVEANLAGVPTEWTGDVATGAGPPEDASP
jgi:hypothetical protein